MRLQTALLVILPLFTCCNESSNASRMKTNPLKLNGNDDSMNPYATIDDIPLPNGYHRLSQKEDSFGSWLRTVPLKKDKTIHLYDGRLKDDQTVQFAVLDISTGKKDLQQCADAIMRLRAEYLYSKGRYHEINFSDNNHTHYVLQTAGNRAAFDQYLERVFASCGTLSLEQQLVSSKSMADIEPGDVFIRGGSPGHAMLVADVAVNDKKERMYLLLQGYMPAQDIHIVLNPNDNHLSPWYPAVDNSVIRTPEYTFISSQLRSWPHN